MFTLTIRTGNAAFTDDGSPTDELARILRDVADTVEAGVTSGRVRDVNGNTVGEFQWQEPTS